MSRKNILIAAAVLGLGYAIFNGGSGVDADAKKVATLMSEAQKMASQPTDMEAISKSAELMNKARALRDELDGKYKTPEQKKALEKAIAFEMKKLKAN